MQHPIGEHALLADSGPPRSSIPTATWRGSAGRGSTATPLLFSILDADRGGTFSLRPALREARVLSRRYHPRSLVLETVWEVGPARLIVDEALDLEEGPLLVRSVRAEGDAVDVTATVSAPAWPGTAASLRIIDHALELDGVSRVVVHAPSRWEARTRRCYLRVHGGSGDSADCHARDGERQSHAASPSSRRSPSGGEGCPESSAHNNTSSDMRDLLGTTAAVLVGLRRSNGGIVAAPTTSLPQWPGSARTWDYRYCWLRNSSLAALAMLRLGLTDEARSLGAFLGNVVMNSGPVPLVRLDGSAPPDETEIPDLAGYAGARPVRIGNAAAGQAQLDVPGEVIELRSLAWRGHPRCPTSSRQRCRSSRDGSSNTGASPTTGSGRYAASRGRYTHSLVTAVSGLRGAAALADQRSVSGDARRMAAGAAAAAARPRHDAARSSSASTAEVPTPRSPRWLSSAGSRPIAQRVDATLDLIAQRLDHGGLVDRYEGQPDMIADPCAPFVFPTFWLAGALAATGRDGSRWLEAALATRGPLGLFGEVADPDNHTPLGNYPQVQSHAAFVLAVADPKGSS